MSVMSYRKYTKICVHIEIFNKGLLTVEQLKQRTLMNKIRFSFAS